MSRIAVIERLPTPAEYNALRSAVGWRPHPEDAIAKALPNTLYCVCAYVDDELAGMARVIGDQGLAYYVQDVIVIPTYQGQGIGTQIMDRVMAYLHQSSQTATFGLMAASGKEAFYEKYGFTRRPTDKMGAGMTIHPGG